MPSKQKLQRKSNQKQIKPKNLSRYKFVLFALLFAVVGTTLIFKGNAAKWTCTPNQPTVRTSASYSWAEEGQWATPGLPRNYPMGIINNDCVKQTYKISVEVPAGFIATLDKNEVTLDAYGSSKLIPSEIANLNVTSPSGIADGDYPITVNIVSTSNPEMRASDTNYYKVYSVDNVAPKFGVTNPFGTIKASRQTNVIANVQDDHILKTVEFYIDGNLVYTRDCSTETMYFCQPTYVWDSSKAIGSHKVLYKATDLFGNTSSSTVDFTVVR